jgi:S-adenosylmethionine decarboxylase
MSNSIQGLHLVVDGNVIDPTRFTEDNLYKLFLELVNVLEMTLIHGPIFKLVELEPSKLSGDVFQDEGGISGYAMISTSHMSAHCWPLRRVFMMDIFSCKMFDQQKAMAVIEQFLAPSEFKIRAIVRTPANSP